MMRVLETLFDQDFKSVLSLAYVPKSVTLNVSG